MALQAAFVTSGSLKFQPIVTQSDIKRKFKNRLMCYVGHRPLFEAYLITHDVSENRSDVRGKEPYSVGPVTHRLDH
jgi:hypothetical protein